MVISSIGTWMHDVGAAWLMTTLAPDPLNVALVQAATTLPIFLLALPSGAIADIVDKRRLLIMVNLLMAVTALLLSALVGVGWITPGLLLMFTFVLGAGAAFVAPAWQAIVPQLVPRNALGSAIALNSMGLNVSRAIGPALAGVLIVTLGLSAPFLSNALSFVAIIAALAWWRPPPTRASALPTERVGEAIVNGLRYTLHSEALRATLIRAVAFFLFASAFWALLPVIAKTSLHGDARLYGFLLGSVGVGAVGGALLRPRIRSRMSADGVVAFGTLGTCLVLGLFALTDSPYIAVAASLLAGMFWILVLSTLHVSAQTALPDWVRARGLSIFLTVFFGAMALGSVVWGKLASELSVSAALLVAAGGALLAIALTRGAHLGQGETLDLAPSMHWQSPLIIAETPHDRGPVLILIEYQIDAADADAFLDLMRNLAQARRRAGAVQWGIMQDGERPEQYVEYFFESSWLAHLRHHERVAGADRVLQDRVLALHRGDSPPQVRHLLASPISRNV